MGRIIAITNAKMDWDLLRRSPAEVARAINIRRLRLRLRQIAAALNQLGLPEVNVLLDPRAFGG